MTARLLADSRCGIYLDDCKCKRTGPVVHTAAEMKARHRASVQRAERSGWAVRTLAETRTGRVSLDHLRKGAA